MKQYFSGRSWIDEQFVVN